MKTCKTELGKLRQSMGLTGVQIADALGVKSTTISAIENTENIAEVERLYKEYLVNYAKKQSVKLSSLVIA